MGARLRWALATVLLLAPCSLQLVECVPWENPLEAQQQRGGAAGLERGAAGTAEAATEFRSTLEMHATRDPVLPHGPSMKLYHVSSCIGINNCRLLGNIYDPKKNKTEVTMLHMWVRIIVEGRTARLKGFGIMEPLEYYRRFSKHASHTLMLYAYKPVLFLKSPYTGRMYGPIVVTYKYSGLEIPMAFNAFIDNLDEEDAIHREFEIRSNHTTYYCEVFGERLRRRMPQPVDGTKELALNKPAYVLFSSFHHMPASQVAPLLYYHMQWHKKLGVSHYTIYQEHMVKGLVSDPRIKDLIRSGLLTIVFFDEFRLHENNLPAPTLNDYLDDAYANQVLVYNHGVLAHWLLDVYVIVSDIDEYLMTPKHMALPEAMRECAVLNGTSLPVSTVTVLRYDAYCRGCNQSESELPQWVNHQGTEHPITKYVMLENTRSEKGNADNTKYIILPGLVDIVKVHKAYPVNGTERIAGDVACLRLLHLYQMLVERKTYDGGDASLDPAQMPVVPDDQWWWPVRDFLSQQQQQQQGGGLGVGLRKRQSHRKALAASHSMIIDAAGAA